MEVAAAVESKVLAIVKIKNLNHSATTVFLSGGYNLPGGQYVMLNEAGARVEVKWKKNLVPLDRVFSELEEKYRISAEELGDKKAAGQVKFYQEHPNVHDINAGPDELGCGFEIEVLADSVKKGITELDQFADCFAVGNEMKESRLREVMIYFTIENSGKLTYGDMRLTLLNPKNGIVRMGDARMEKFHKVFVAEQSEAAVEETSLKLMIRTAINEGHIKKDGGPFMMGEVMMGTSENDVVSYLRNNPQFKSALESKLAPEDKAKEDLSKFTPVERKIIDRYLEVLKVTPKARATDARFDELKAAQAEAGNPVLTREELRKESLT